MRCTFPSSVVERVLSKTEPQGDCIVSLYSTASHGYAQVGWHDRAIGRSVMTLCHRVAWFGAHGEIPDGMTVDHVCHNRRCVNVEHLRLLTNVDNARLNGNAIKTHCLHGHPFSEANTRTGERGHRRCIACDNERNAARPSGKAA